MAFIAQTTTTERRLFARILARAVAEKPLHSAKILLQRVNVELLQEIFPHLNQERPHKMLNTPKTSGTVIPTLLLSFLVMLPIQAHSDTDSANAPSPLPKVKIVTNKGPFTLQLRPDVAPETVDNFLAYVKSGFYENTVFHRVIPGFMIQGGGFTDNLARKSTRDPITNEASQTLKNLRGTISMARTSDPDSATSQFFINLVDNGFLDAGVRGAGYAVFGKVTEGMGVVDTIGGVDTGYAKGMADVPTDPVVIESVSVLPSAK